MKIFWPGLFVLTLISNSSELVGSPVNREIGLEAVNPADTIVSYRASSMVIKSDSLVFSDTVVAKKDTLLRRDTVVIKRDTLQSRDTLVLNVKDTATLSPSSARLKPPISPKRAFFTSLLLPGYAQAQLGRSTSSMIYAVFEVVSIGMLRKSAQDLKAARNSGRDSIIIGYAPGPGGVLIPAYGPSKYIGDRVKARKLHYEDWIAALAFNHLISAADAYVAAYLWDFKANIDLSTGADGDRKAKIGLQKSF